MSLAMSERYSRQTRLPEVGPDGQKRIAATRALIIGVGGLGAPCALYLAAAGIGALGLVDADVVALSNLQRQILYRTAEHGELKVHAAALHLEALNPEIEVITHPERLTAENAEMIAQSYDLLIDGTDNLESRRLISWISRRLGKPHVYAGIFRFEGHVAIFDGRQAPCYHCLFPELPAVGDIPNCGEAGVLGPLAGVVGSLQSLEVLKDVLGLSRRGRLSVFDGLSLEMRTLGVSARPTCANCKGTFHPSADAAAELPFIRSLSEAPASAVWLDVRSADEFAQTHLSQARHIELSQLPSALSDLPTGATYIVYCESGQRSLNAQKLMHARGFNSVFNLRGGLRNA